MEVCDENALNEAGGRTAWVSAQLRDLNMTAPKCLMDADVLEAFQQLLNERNRAKDHAMVVNDECNELRAQTHALERTLEVQTTHTEVARQETASVGSRLLSLQTQHAQMKTQWSAEKAEMEGRVFQALSLQQSTLGTMRKREKDFDQLQSQLARMLKDSQRAQKCCLLVSKPLPRQWNASSTEPTLKDAEVLALQASLASASEEIEGLQRALATAPTDSNPELESKLAAANARLVAKESEVGSLGMRLFELQQERVVLQTDMSVLQSSVDGLERDLSSASLTLEAKQRELAVALEQLHCEQRQAADERGAHLAQIQALSESLEEVRGESCAREAEAHAVLVSRDESRLQCISLIAQISHLQQAASALESSLASAEECAQSRQREVVDAEARLVATEQLLRTDNSILSENLRAANALVMRLEENASALELQLSTTSGELCTLRQQSTQTLEALQLKSAEAEDLLAAIDAAAREKASLEEAAAAERADWSRRLEAAEAELCAAREQASAEMGLLTAALDVANVARDQLTSTCQALSADVQLKRQEIDRLTELMRQADASSSALEASLRLQLETAAELLAQKHDDSDYAKLFARARELEHELRSNQQQMRGLRNTIAELRGNVRVYARIRPFLPFDGPVTASPSIATNEDSSSVSVRPVSDREEEQAFTFDKTFGPSASQDRIFSDVSELVQSALDGYNVCLFSYGQTGSGKSFTMSGYGEGAERGIIPRALEQVGKYKVELEAKGWVYTMEVSYIEIYNENIKDLLRTSATDSTKHEIKKDVSGGTYVSDVTMLELDPNNSADICAVTETAAKHRSVASTAMNEESSRSHSVFTLYLKASNAELGESLRGTLSLVDLAGSERLDRSGATGSRMRETISINKSLSSLVDVFAAIGSKQAHIPFRNSKLTYLLQPALSGDGKTLMIVSISPTEESRHESICSLRFARQVNQCELGKPTRQVTRDSVQNATPLSSAATPMSSNSLHVKKMARFR